MNIDDVVEKIKKAVRLANKTTSAGERETAMRLARRLAERNGVAFEDVAEEAAVDRTVKEDDENLVSIRGSEFGYACQIIKTHFGVIIMRGVYRNCGSRNSRLSWIGSRLNIDIARHVYHVLVRESGRAWREAKKAMSNLRLDRQTFMQGFFYALHRKLTECPLRNDLDQSIKAAERRLLSYMQDGHDVETKKSRDRKNPDEGSLMMGFAAGSAVNLARPCDARNAAIVPQIAAAV